MDERLEQAEVEPSDVLDGLREQARTIAHPCASNMERSVFSVPKYRVLLSASIPLYNWCEVDADSPEEAKQKALEISASWQAKDWNVAGDEVVDLFVEDWEESSESKV